MEFRQIEAFIKVVEKRSFSKAADELYVSQPSVSTYITALEEELNSVLLNRSTKELSLTFAGERFFGKAKEMIALKKETVEIIKNLSGDLSGDISILASTVPSQYLLPPILAGFHTQYPKIYFNLHQADTAEVVHGITTHKADVGFTGSILGAQKCSFHEFVSEKLVFIAPNDSQYSETRKHTLEELLYTNNFISRESGSGTRLQYEKFFIENGIHLSKIKTVASIDNTYSIINAVVNGLGISMVSEFAVRTMFEQKKLRKIRLKIPLPVRKIYAVLNKNIVHSHLVELFMKYVLANAPLR
jgi:DNA-binding transcriptional LysR family regulator